MFGFQRKSVPRLYLVRGKGKCWSRQPPTRGTTTPIPHPSKIKKCSVFNENRYQDYIWCEEKENAGPDNRRPVERSHQCPTPLKLRNVRFQRKSVPRLYLVRGKGKCWSRQPPTRGTTTPIPHPSKIKKCSVFNENRYQDYIWCEEKENAGPDNRRPVERSHQCPTPLKLRNVRFQRKSVPRLYLVRGKGKCWSRQPPTRGTTTPMPRPSKIKKCSVFNENRYQDYIWCEEKENAGPDNRRPVERSHQCPTPLKLRNIRFQRKSVPRLYLVRGKGKCWSRQPPPRGTTTPMPHPSKVKKCSVFNENRYQDYFWYGDTENAGPDGLRPVERPPRPPQYN